jgi:hypothetical protein
VLIKKTIKSNEKFMGAKKILLAILGLAFAFAVSSCGDQGKKGDAKKCSEKLEKHHDRW